jgi:hypothetical protein
MTSARQLRETGTDIERMLLSAGAAERPDADSVRRAAKVLGVVPRAALIAATLGIAIRATRWTTIAAWTSVPFVGAIGVALMTHHATAPLAPPSTLVAAAPHAAQGAPAPRMPDVKTAPVGTAALVETARLRVVAPEPAASPPRASTRKTAPIASASADRLGEQADALDGVRALLTSGEPNGALSRLDDFDRRFAGGPLHEESQLLRIEALAREGDRTAAASLARRFLKTYPASVHVDRVAAIVQSMTP